MPLCSSKPPVSKAPLNTAAAPVLVSASVAVLGVCPPSWKARRAVLGAIPGEGVSSPPCSTVKQALNESHCKLQKGSEAVALLLCVEKFPQRFIAPLHPQVILQ